jgi:hypothetical protein
MAAAVVGLIAACLLVSACDASPYAANVNGQVITQLALNTQLKEYAANEAFVTALTSNGNNLPVTGAGGPGTYDISFVNTILTRLVVDMIVRQHLVATNSLPPPDSYVAARAVWQLTGSAYWSKFSPSIRSSLVEQTADFGQLVPDSTLAANQSTIQQAYTQLEPYLFSELCVDQASAFTLSAAQALVASGVATGTNVCFDQVEMELQPEAFQSAVRQLQVGQVSQPIQVSYGYVVAKLTSRQSPGNSPPVQRVIYSATSMQGIPGLAPLATAARVRINPAYGTWDGTNIAITPPPTTGT